MLLFSPNTLPSQLLSKNLKTKIYKTIILPVELYGCEAWPLNFREVFKNDPEAKFRAEEG